MLNYFNNLITQVRKFHKESKDLDYAIQNTLVKNKHDWLLYEEYHPRNVSKNVYRVRMGINYLFRCN